VTDSKGLPLTAIVTGANTHDSTVALRLLDPDTPHKGWEEAPEA